MLLLRARPPICRLPSHPLSNSSSPLLAFSRRSRGDLAPKRVKYRKAFKGNVKARTGGSLNGTTLERGDFGIRVKEPIRLSAKILKSCETSIKKGIKSVKGAECYLRIFPDIPVCVKGNEVRMGKGKGAFEYWACRAPVGRVLFEVGGGGIQQEVAYAALRLAQPKLPVTSELINKTSKARLGSILVDRPGRINTNVESDGQLDELESLLAQVQAFTLQESKLVTPSAS